MYIWIYVYIYIYIYIYTYISGWPVLGTEQALTLTRFQPAQTHRTSGPHAPLSAAGMAWHGLQHGTACMVATTPDWKFQRAE